MIKASIYQFVKDKLITHGVENTKGGLLILSDQKLLLLFVKLERAVRDSSFDASVSAALEIENYLISIEKQQLMAFTYLYLMFSDITSKLTELDKQLPEVTIQESKVVLRNVTNEETLIRLWGQVKYEQIGERLLEVVYADPSTSLDGH